MKYLPVTGLILAVAFMFATFAAWPQNEKLDAQETAPTLSEEYNAAPLEYKCDWEVRVVFYGASAKMEKRPFVIKHVDSAMGQAMEAMGVAPPMDGIYVWDWDLFTTADQELIKKFLAHGYNTVKEGDNAQDFMNAYLAKCMSEQGS